MRKVFLHGELGNSLGKEWDLEIDSVQEIFCAIDANTNKFTKFLADNSYLNLQKQKNKKKLDLIYSEEHKMLQLKEFLCHLDMADLELVLR